MSDRTFTSARLSGPPNAGYATTRERKASDVIMLWMRAVERCRPMLLTIVCGGLDEWRRIARPRFRAHGIRDVTIDEMFRVLTEWAGADPMMQLVRLHGQVEAQQVLSYDGREKTRTALEEGIKAAMKDFARDRTH